MNRLEVESENGLMFARSGNIGRCSAVAVCWHRRPYGRKVSLRRLIFPLDQPSKLAFSLFGKKPPAKVPSAPRRPEARKPNPLPTPAKPVAEEDSFSLDFTNYAPPATVLSEAPASESPLSEPQFESPAAPGVARESVAPVSLPPLDFGSLPGIASEPASSAAPSTATKSSAKRTAGTVSAAGASVAPKNAESESGAPLDSILLIEVESGSQEVPTVVEEAAVLFANGQSQEALDTLNRAIEAGSLDTWTLPAWLMRFDLYQQLGRKSEFEEEALHFVVKFERSPPAWNDLPGVAGPSSRPGGSAHIALSGSLSSSSAAAFAQMIKASERHPKLHLDFSKLEGADAEGCQLLLDTLRKLRKAKKEVYISGEARAFELLQAKSADGDTPIWLLLLDLYQQLGMQEEFEEAAVNYAVTFEVSPPSWEARARVEPPPPAAPSGGGRRDESDDSYRLEGDIAGEQDALFADLLKYATAANPVVVDLSGARRIDFINAGKLLHVVEKAHAAKRPVVLRSAGEMMMALFAVMGIHKLARIIPRK